MADFETAQRRVLAVSQHSAGSSPYHSQSGDHPMTMTLSDAGVAFIVSFEGKLRPCGDGTYKAYSCPAGVTTIYAGCTTGVTDGMICTEAEGLQMFKIELHQHILAVNEMVKVDLTQNEFDALVSLSYNIGSSGLRQSTLLRKLNAGDYDGAAEQFGRWDKVHGSPMRGLTRRRAAERDLFDTLDGVSSSHAPPLVDAPMPQAVDPVPHKQWHQSKTVWAQVIAVPAVVSGYAAQIHESLDQVSQTAHDAAGLGLMQLARQHILTPTILLSLLGIGALVFVLKERLLKLVEGV